MEREMQMQMQMESPSTAGDLILSLEQATLMAKQLQNVGDSSQILQIYTALQSTHRHLSLFLSHHQPPLPDISNSVSSAVGCGGGDENGEPMQVGDDEDDEHNSKNTASAVDRVEERMRDCFIQNKRPKRPLSPSAAVAEQRRNYENMAVMGGFAAEEFDPHRTRLRSLDLIYQFHG